MLFQIKEGSKLQEVVAILAKEPSLTAAQLIERGCQRSAVRAAFFLARNSTNYVRGRYSDPSIAIARSAHHAVQPVEVSPAVQPEPENDNAEDAHRELIFPDAPPVVAVMRNFKRPTWYARLESMVDCGKNVALSGPPGIGKSTAVEQLASARGVPLVNIGADSGLRRRDLVGTQEIVNRHTAFQVAEYAAAVINGWWAKIDEVNAAEPDALMFINGQIAPPYCISVHGRTYPVHPNFRLFIAYNPGLVGTKPLPDSFKDRFFPIRVDFPSGKGLYRLLKATGIEIEERLMLTIVGCGLECWKQHTAGRCRYQITPRRLADAMLLVSHGESIETALRAAIVGAIDNPAEARVITEAVRVAVQQAGFGLNDITSEGEA